MGQLEPTAYGPLLDGLARLQYVPTIIEGGFRANVLPGTAEATVNVRMLPGQRPRPTIRALERVIDDPRVKVTPIGRPGVSEAETLDTFDTRAKLAPSSMDSSLYRSVARRARGQWPGARVAPVLFEAGTDAYPWRSRGIPVYGIYPYPGAGGSRADVRQRRARAHPRTRAGHGHGHRRPARRGGALRPRGRGGRRGG